MKMETHDVKSMGCHKNNSKKEVYSNISLPQETREVTNTQPNLKQLEKGKQNPTEGKKS